MGVRQGSVIFVVCCLCILLISCGIKNSSFTGHEDYSGENYWRVENIITPSGFNLQLIASDIEASADIEAESATEAGMIGYPSEEEIRVSLETGEKKLYWLASMPSYPEALTIYSISTPDMKELWFKLSKVILDGAVIVGSEENIEAYRLTYSLGGIEYVVSIEASAITIDSTDSPVSTELLLNALEEATGTIYKKGYMREDADIVETRYVQMVDGYCVDETGYSPEGDVWISGTSVDIRRDGSIFINNPIILGDEIAHIDDSELIPVENIETICQAYYQTYGPPSVMVTSDVDLVFFCENQQLRPAWRCSQIVYMSTNIHYDSQMIDVKTGELIRK